MNFNLTLIGQSITFFLFVWFCFKFIWPPLVKALDERKQKIADGLAAAERGEKAQEVGEKAAEALIAEAKEQARTIISQAEKRNAEIVDEAKDEAKEEAERIIVAAKAEVEQ